MNCFFLVGNAQLLLTAQKDQITIENGIVAFIFNKNNADLKSIKYLNYENVLGKKGSAYLSGPDFGMFPAQYSITTHTKDIIDISFLHTDKKNHFSYDLHYVLKNGVSGIYIYLIEKHSKNDSIGVYGQTRWGLRADPNIFDHHLVRDSIQGPMYSMDSLESGEKLQDWTYKMKNGIIYTKYDYADYINERFVHGMAGQKSNIGIFVVQASQDYLNGGPTKQYITTHSNPYLIYMFNCSHFLNTDRKADDTISGDWEKINGPFLLYLNKGDDIKSIWADAKKEAQIQKKQWPYTWLKNTAYPLHRGVLEINATTEKKSSIADYTFVLADSSHDWQAQSQGYDYWGKTDKVGYLDIHNIRPGKYTLYGFGGNRLQPFRKDDIIIDSNQTTKINATIPDEFKNIVWQIGIADRFTKGFQYANHHRAYGLFDSIPTNLEYVIDKNTDMDWYYAQTKVGNWKINFSNNGIKNTDSLTLYFALAGVAKNPLLQVKLNGESIGLLHNLGNDRSIYRSAILGGYYQLVSIKFPSKLLKNSNELELKMEKCPKGGGLMYDAIRLSYN